MISSSFLRRLFLFTFTTIVSIPIRTLKLCLHVGDNNWLITIKSALPEGPRNRSRFGELYNQPTVVANMQTQYQRSNGYGNNSGRNEKKPSWKKED